MPWKLKVNLGEIVVHVLTIKTGTYNFVTIIFVLMENLINIVGARMKEAFKVEYNFAPLIYCIVINYCLIFEKYNVILLTWLHDFGQCITFLESRALTTSY